MNDFDRRIILSQLVVLTDFAPADSAARGLLLAVGGAIAGGDEADMFLYLYPFIMRKAEECGRLREFEQAMLGGRNGQDE